MKVNKVIEYPMFFEAKPKIFELANDLRKSSTKAEMIVWKVIRNRRIKNQKFRRQHPIDTFIADFYCPQKKLVIEIDGGIHNIKENKEYDIERERILKKHGLKILRFKNEEVEKNINKVIKKISECL
ncbi:MAG: endonuclease domain-containing protein [Bacteroidales bacterium]|nr:endonuclease domain-containing protein [Bacteroidales bacterium]